MQIISKDQNVYDAVVVGSGATGGWVAKTLSEAGMQVALLEAGHRTTEAEFTEHLQPYDLKYRGQSPEIARNRPIQSMKYACRESNFKWFVDDIRNPYTYPADKPFQWTRGRQLGGRSLTWARQSYRLSPLDFSAASHDGYGENWPVTYEEMVPYYETVERYVGISGEPLGLMQFPDSIMQPPMAMTCGEKHFKRKVNARYDRNVTIGRTAILTKPSTDATPATTAARASTAASPIPIFRVSGPPLPTRRSPVTARCSPTRSFPTSPQTRARASPMAWPTTIA